MTVKGNWLVSGGIYIKVATQDYVIGLDIILFEDNLYDFVPFRIL